MEIVPVLMNWDNRIIDGLFNLSEVMQNYNEILNKSIENFNENEIGNIETLNTTKLYWKHGIYKLFKFYITNKSLAVLISRLELWKNKYNSIDINKKSLIIVSNNLTIIIIKRLNNKYELIKKYDNTQN
jgi:hypothetical protein